jgi:hypothetical protein
MSDIVQLLIGKEESIIESGTISEYLGAGKYRVVLGGGRQLIIRSAVQRFFNNGARVVINKIRDSRYIIGVTGHTDTATAREVVINA